MAANLKMLRRPVVKLKNDSSRSGRSGGAASVSAIKSAIKRRVLIPEKRWTPVQKIVFEQILGKLTGKQSALVYLILYDRAYHRPGATLFATNADVQRWTKLNHRTVRECFAELHRKKLIEKTQMGISRSKTNKPGWRVPLADSELQEDPSWVRPIRAVLAKRRPTA